MRQGSQQARIAMQGNPRFYHTFSDENYNGILARIAAVTHPMRFGETVFRKTFLKSQQTA